MVTMPTAAVAPTPTVPAATEPATMSWWYTSPAATSTDWALLAPALVWLTCALLPMWAVVVHVVRGAVLEPGDGGSATGAVRARVAGAGAEGVGQVDVVSAHVAGRGHVAWEEARRAVVARPGLVGRHEAVRLADRGDRRGPRGEVLGGGAAGVCVTR